MRKRGIVWDYFTLADKVNKRARCNDCKKSLSFKTTISNLKNHLKMRHVDYYEELCNKLKEDLSNEGESNDKKLFEDDREVIYEYVVENESRSCSVSEADEPMKETYSGRTTPSIRKFRKRSTLNDENATGKSKERNLIEQLTAEKMQVTLLQKELIQKELEERNLKILLVEKEIEHKNIMYEQEKKDIEHKNMMYEQEKKDIEHKNMMYEQEKKDIEHKNMMYEQEKKDIEHKNYINVLQKEAMLLKIELLKSSLLEVKKRSPDPDLPTL